MVNVAPAALVEGAVRQTLAHGLFSAFTLRPDSRDRWESGARWEPGTCEPVDGIGQAQCDPEDTVGLPKELDSNLPGWGNASPFTVYGHFQCSPVGYSAERAQALADDHLYAREEARVERAFWTGDLGNIPNLRQTLDTDGTPVLTEVVNPTPGTAVDFVVGLGLLEAALAESYGSIGVIHMSRLAGSVATSRQVVQTTGGRLTSHLGTPIVAGAGYPGTGPTGQVPTGNTTWMYATPALFGYRSEVFRSSNRPGDLFDRARNDLYAVAERSYLLGFDPCGVFAVLVDLDPA